MLIAILIWTALVAGLYFFSSALLALLAPALAWLQSNPDLAVWIDPLLGIAGTLGVTAVIVVWLLGVGVIALFGVGRRRARAAYEGWRGRDDYGPPPDRWGRYEAEPRRRRSRRDDDDDDDDDDRRRRRSSYRRRDDDDDD
jgi:hypothetical protein